MIQLMISEGWFRGKQVKKPDYTWFLHLKDYMEHLCWVLRVLGSDIMLALKAVALWQVEWEVRKQS